MFLTNYKHTQPTLGLSVTFVFNIEYIHTYIYTHIYYTHIYTYAHTHTHTHTHTHMLIKRTYIHVLQNR